jgi:hypothetical protein
MNLLIHPKLLPRPSSAVSRREQFAFRAIALMQILKRFKLSSLFLVVYVDIFRYTDTQQFRKHTDWLDPEQDEGVQKHGNRESSFFVYLVANCTGGTTVFTKVCRPEAEEWCDALKCHDENGESVEWLEVEPKVGRAIFWWNLDPSGVGDDDTMLQEQRLN